MCLALVFVNKNVSARDLRRLTDFMPRIVAHASEESLSDHARVNPEEVTVRFSNGEAPDGSSPFRIQLMALPQALCVNAMAGAIQRRIRKLQVTTEELPGSFVNLVPG